MVKKISVKQEENVVNVFGIKKEMDVKTEELNGQSALTYSLRPRKAKLEIKSEPKEFEEIPTEGASAYRASENKLEAKDVVKLTKKRGNKEETGTNEKRLKMKKEVKIEYCPCPSEVQARMIKTVGAKVLKFAKDNNTNKKLGAHVSAADGLHNAIYNALSLGCQSLAMFVRNQRTWVSKPLDEQVVQNWNQVIKETGFPLKSIVPHGSYLINVGSPEPEKLEKSRQAMLDECQRCERLGIGLYNFHPGSTVNKCTKEECMRTIAESINFVHEKTEFITLVLETTAGSGNTVGGKFSDLSAIIEQVMDKSRVGVCIDTCHAFAAGYDLRTKESYNKVMEDFEATVGFKYLKAVHLNDSKGALSSFVDRHACLGEGNLKYRAFELLMKDDRFDNIPMVLETPDGDRYSKEMMKLYELEIKKE